MHDSYTPLGGLVPLWLMHQGEVVFGGVGSGLYGMLAFAIIAVFIAGLMVGRTPEYLGKKIEAFEMKMAALLVLVMPMIVLVGAAAAVATDAGRAGISNPGRTASARCSMRSLRPATTTAAPLPASTETIRSTTSRWRLSCWWAATGSPFRIGHRRLDGAKEGNAHKRRHAADAYAAVHRVSGRRRDFGRGVDVHTRVGPRTDRRALDDDRWMNYGE